MINLSEILEYNPSDYLKDYELSDCDYLNYRILIDKYYHYNKFSNYDINIITNNNFNNLLKLSMNLEKKMRYSFITEFIFKEYKKDFYKTKYTSKIISNDNLLDTNNETTNKYHEIIKEYR